MDMTKRLNIVAMALAVSVCAMASGRKDDAPKQAYLFGVGISLTDSTAFITDIQTVDSLFLNEEGFLPHEAEYSLQMKLYLANRMNMRDKVCTVFYDDNQKDLQKQMSKVEGKLKDGGYKDLVRMVKSDFAFVLYKED